MHLVGKVGNHNVDLGEASGGRGQASGALGEASGGRGQSNAAKFQANTERGESSDGRGKAGGRGGRGRGRGGRGRGRGVTTMLVDEEEMNEEEIRKNMEHEYMEQIVIEEEEKRIAAEKEIQEEFDEKAVRLTLEEEPRYEKEYHDKIREDEESEYNQMWYNHGITLPKSASTRVECGTTYVQTQESIAQPSVAATGTTPKGKTIEADAAEPPKLKKQGRKRKVAEPTIFLYPLGAVEAACALEVDAIGALDLVEAVGALDRVVVEEVGAVDVVGLSLNILISASLCGYLTSLYKTKSSSPKNLHR
ncbi:hypothetical protein Tco_1178846 [Tanacetum coccineum]